MVASDRSGATDEADLLWRSQVVLTAVAVVAFAGVAGLTRLVLSDWGRSPSNEAVLYLAAGVTGLALVGLMIAVCRHVVRTARLTFRSYDSDTD